VLILRQPSGALVIPDDLARRARDSGFAFREEARARYSETLDLILLGVALAR
jgi:hypothetical protein